MKLYRHRLVVIQLFMLLLLPLPILAANWEPINSPTGGPVINLISYQGDVIANAINSGIYQKPSNDEIWTRVSPANHPLRFTEYLFNDGNVIYAATAQAGIFKSTNNGLDWTNIHNGLTQNNRPIRVNIIKKIESSVMFGSNEGLFYTSDAGNSWEYFPNNEPQKNIFDFEKQDDFLYILTNSGCFRSSNLGVNWDLIDFSLPSINCYKLLKMDENLMFCIQDTTGKVGFLYSILEKKSGSDDIIQYYPDEFNNFRVLGFYADDDVFSLSAANPLDNKLNYKIFFSSDKGQLWKSRFDTTLYHKLFLTDALISDGHYIYAGTQNEGVLRININDDSSEILSLNIHNIQMTTIAFKNSDSYIGTTSNGIFYSGNSGSSWIQLTSSPKANPEVYHNIFKITFNNEIILAGTDNGIFSSNDEGSSWKSLGLNSNVVIDIIVENNIIYAAGNLFSGNLYISSDAGESWATRPIPENAILTGFLKDGNNIIVTTDKGIYLTSNSGLNWEKVLADYPSVNTLLPIVRSGNVLLAASIRGIYVSENNGFEWKKADNLLSNTQIINLGSFGQSLFCSTPTNVYMSLNNGTDWYNITDDLGNLPVSSFGFKPNEVYALLSRDAIYKTKLIDLSKIKINNLQNDIYCNDSEFDINYSVDTNIVFSDDNLFIAELSDVNGKFSDENTIIGTINSVTSGVIKAKIPTGIPFGTGYRIRLRSTNPAYISIDNLFNIIILERSEPVISGANIACAGETKTYSTQTNPGFNYKWSVTNGEIIGNDNTASVTVRWNEVGSSSLKVLQQSIQSCSDSNFITVLIHPVPDKPVISNNELTLISSAETGNQWYFNGVELVGEINQTYTPVLDGIYTVIVKNEFGCISEASEPFNFEYFEDKLVIEFDDSEAFDGDEVAINIRLVKNKKYYQLGVQRIKATLVFNASLLYPLSEDKGVIIDGKRYIQIDIDTNYISQDIVKVLRFTAMLGNAEKTDLTLENVLINDEPESSIRVIAGTFTLLDICYDGGARLITSIPPPSIESISPNPADERIHFSIKNLENITAKIYLMNTLGIVEKVFFTGYLTEGMHDFSYPLGGISIGNHYLILETTHSSVMRNFVISR